MLDFQGMVAKLRTATESGRPVRHQAIILLWAIGNARHGRPRLVRWSQAQAPLRTLLAAHGLPMSKATPEYPFVALARSEWWELPDARDVPTAHGSGVLPWLNTHDPHGGLRSDVYTELRQDERREVAVRALLDRFFPDVDTSAVLRATDLAT